jgi:hypothetical protein
MREVIEMADGRAGLDPANLRLCQIEPASNDFLRYSVLSIQRNVARMLPICPRYLPDVLRREGITKLFGFPEVS